LQIVEFGFKLNEAITVQKPAMVQRDCNTLDVISVTDRYFQ